MKRSQRQNLVILKIKSFSLFKSTLHFLLFNHSSRLILSLLKEDDVLRDFKLRFSSSLVIVRYLHKRSYAAHTDHHVLTNAFDK